MKTKILSLSLLVIMMSFAMNSNAENSDTIKKTEAVSQNEFQASINLFPNNIVQFQIEKPANDKVTLSVYDDAGIKLYSYILKKDNVARIGFDMSMLEAGKYEYVIKRNKAEVLRKSISNENTGQ